MNESVIVLCMKYFFLYLLSFALFSCANNADSEKALDDSDDPSTEVEEEEVSYPDGYCPMDGLPSEVYLFGNSDYRTKEMEWIFIIVTENIAHRVVVEVYIDHDGEQSITELNLQTNSTPWQGKLAGPSIMAGAPIISPARHLPEGVPDFWFLTLNIDANIEAENSFVVDTSVFVEEDVALVFWIYDIHGTVLDCVVMANPDIYNSMYGEIE